MRGAGHCGRADTWGARTVFPTNESNNLTDKDNNLS